MKKVEFIPAILEKTSEAFLANVAILKKSKIKCAHLDIMDGQAVPNKSYYDIGTISGSDIDWEVHIMTKNPLVEAAKWFSIQNVKRVIVRGEEILDWAEFATFSKIFEKLGIAFDPDTAIPDNFMELSQANFILAMGVNSGFSGQTFNNKTLDRIAMLKRKYPFLPIGVDGGMNKEVIPLVKRLGVSVINAASFFWDNSDKKSVIDFVENDAEWNMAI